jgi:hypothetical protein
MPTLAEMPPRSDWAAAFQGAAELALARAPLGLIDGFEEQPRKRALPDDTRERAAFEHMVKRHRDRDRRVRKAFLHNPMAAALTNSDESILLQYPTSLDAREDPKLTQPEPLPA